MEHTFLKRAKEMLEERRKRARLRQAVTAMMVLVAFSTSYLLMMPAITLGDGTPTCGIEAHEHDDSCYETRLVCSDVSKPGHSHSDACYSESYTCGQSESEAHAHSDSCWSVTCGQKEGAGHSHGDSCYGNTCGQSESAGHSHSDACYTESTSRTCGQSESSGHSHGDSCYGEDGSQICGQSESVGHSHSDSCYTTSRELTCGESESAGHTHSDSCIGLTCGEGEYEAHTHSDACESMTCGQSESAGHSHDDSCKTKSSEPTCGQEECEAVETDHLHGPACYETSLTCEKPVHSHTDSCYAVVEDNDETVDKEPSDEENSGEELPGEEIPEEIIPEEPTEIILSDEALEKILALDILSDLELPEDPDYSDSLVVDQTISRNENGTYTLTLEAFAKGELPATAVTRPMDLVLVLDQSADLYQPALGEAELAITADDTVMSEEQVEEAARTWGLINRESFWWLEGEDLVLTKAQQKGYFLAQSAGAADSTGEWYLVQYLPEEGWLLESMTGEIETISCESVDEMPEHIRRFYVSRFGKQCDAVSALAEILVLSGADHRMAVVGYAGAESEGSAILTGKGCTYAALSDGELDREAMLASALVPVSNEDELLNEELAESLRAASAGHSGSALAVGLSLAEEILAQADTERDQMVVLLAGSQPDQGLSGCEGEDWAVMDAINVAGTIKNAHGAPIYTIASSELDEDLMGCISSKYPQAAAALVVEEEPEMTEEAALEETAEDPAAEVEEIPAPQLVITAGDEADGDFCLVPETADDLMETVLNLGQVILENTEELNETAVVSAAFAEYFQLIQAAAEEQDAPAIKVYTADYLGGGTFSEEWVEFAEAQVEQIASEEDESRIQSVDVSNFNFSGEILSEADELTGAAGGRKLIVQIPVEVREGFWGGNNVPVSSEETGIYAGGSNVMEFPMPEVNVEMTLDLEAGVATVFYGQTIGIDDLVGKLTVGGTEVIVDCDGAFLPQEDWMDDYAELTWLEKPGEISSTENSEGHVISVNLSPLYEGAGALGKPVGMGFATSEEPEIPVTLEEGQEGIQVPVLSANVVQEETIVGVNANATASVQVMAPVITFQDVVISLGNTPDFATTHIPVKSIEWVNADGGISVGDGSNTPNLTFEYAPMVTEDVYVFDTPMNVTVLHDDVDITNIVTFAGNSCEFNLHDEDESIASHKQLTETGEDLPEFWVHVQSGIELPNTGGMGTKIFYGLGGILVVGAVILLVTKKRMSDNEDDEDEDDDL